jgi:uncharacterized protein (TIGR03435 family)
MRHRILQMYVAVALVAVGLVITSQSLAQSKVEGNPLAFEVASVKPSTPGGRAGGIRPMPGGQTYIATNVPLRLMIKVMYRINDSQIVGGTDWMDTDLWDVEAKAERPSSVDQLHEMFQTLFAERFKLRFHRERKEIAAYVLSVDKSGSKLKVSDSKEPFDIPIKPGDRPGKSVGTRVPMEYLCFYFAQLLNVPVVDQTGLDGFYDFTLELPAPAPLLTPGPAPAADGPDLFTAIRQQLGLKLESRRAPVEVFVIDHVERPTNN